ncbi:TolB family protein [Bacillus salitolerans]|uniref:TolB family protein n=1 Tax=Bacillus salitolerans TaxID=1437434 RepID=A0ABW4LV31_9BACI
MKWVKWLLISFSLLLVITDEGNVAANEQNGIAFIKDGNLWVKEGKGEFQVTKQGSIQFPKWSYDGKWIAYLKNRTEIWAYDTDAQKHVKVSEEGGNVFKWSPSENILAFQTNGTLARIHLDDISVHKVAQGVNQYSWLPDGTGFLVSDVATLTPNGWGSVWLYKIPLTYNKGLKKTDPFYTLPPEGQLEDFFAIATSEFKFSPDGKWISFLAVPTASWSMDSNSLSLLSTDGKTFEVVDKMILHPDWFKWGPTTNKLAYIEGEGRMALQNKELKVKELPAITMEYTPDGFVDGDFTWINDDEIILSRTKESEWFNDPRKRPLPQLVKINLKHKQEEVLTRPKEGIGDFNPYYHQEANKLYWIRTDREKGELWRANPDGSEAEIWIDKLDVPFPYYETWDWKQVIQISTNKK